MLEGVPGALGKGGPGDVGGLGERGGLSSYMGVCLLWTEPLLERLSMIDLGFSSTSMGVTLVLFES